MPTTRRAATERRSLLPTGLTGLAGLACVACCAIPWLIAAGVLGAAGWATLTRWLPAIAVALLSLAGAAWWLTTRRTSRVDTCHEGACRCADGSHVSAVEFASSPNDEQARA